jgi:hypothetical protein
MNFVVIPCPKISSVKTQSPWSGEEDNRRLAKLCRETVPGQTARQVGYRKVTLWTKNVLQATRHLYQSAGFRLVHQEPPHSFGCDLIAETWELKL